jgi:hypothetical protein
MGMGFLNTEVGGRGAFSAMLQLGVYITPCVPKMNVLFNGWRNSPAFADAGGSDAESVVFKAGTVKDGFKGELSVPTRQE